MGSLEQNTTLIYGIHIRESASDGSDFSNGATDYRVLFLGEDGLLHVKDSAGTVTDPFSGGSGIAGTIFDAKGDIIVATAADTAARKSVGSDGTMLVAASGQSDGLLWQAPPVANRVVRTSGDFTMNGAGSDSFADVTGASITFTTLARRVRLGFTGCGSVNNAAGDIRVDFTIDGTRIGGTAGGLVNAGVWTSGESFNLSMNAMTAVLSAGSHTFKVQARQGVTSHTATIYGSDPAWIFWAEETMAIA